MNKEEFSLLISSNLKKSYKSILAQSKVNNDLYNFIDNSNSDFNIINPKLWLLVYNESAYCPYGKLKKWDYKNSVLRCPKCKCTQDRKNKSLIEQYGEDYKEQFNIKRKKTCIKKYNAESPINNPDVREKYVKTNLEKYGVPYAVSSNVVREKAKKTNIERYGTEFANQSELIKEKFKSTMMSRYGVHNPQQVEKIKEKTKQTNLHRYGTEYTSQNKEVIQKQRNTNLKKYGVTSTSQKNYSDKAKKILLNKDYFKTFISNKSIISCAMELNVDKSTICDYYRKYGIDIPTSSYENEISAFLKENNILYIKNTRSVISPLELDFYMFDYKLAIEFNGLYWHSDKFVDKNYHLNKYLACAQKGIRLIMINEDEWISRSESIKRKILNLCGKSEKSIGARKLSIKKIDNKLAHAFVDQYHIQGKTGTAIASYGAFDGHELVAVIQYNKQRGTNDIELIRFCTNGKLYAGVFSRLFKYSVEQEGYDKVLSFADLRYSDGNVYEKNGFSKDKLIRPDYRYVKETHTYHKSTFTKSNIAKKFGIDMSKLTETQAMNELGYNRIYDCGKIKYVWTKEKGDY